MKDELRKSLSDLIDETLQELEELKKSRFGACETDIKGPGEGIAGKPSNGDLHAKAEDKDDEEEDEDAEKAEGDDPADSEETKRKLKGIMGKNDAKTGMPEGTSKAEGTNRQSDPDGGHHKPVAGEGMEHGQGPEHGSHGGKVRGTSGHNSESDPGETHWTEKSDKDEKDDKKKKKDKDAKGGEEHEAEEKDAIGKLANLAGMKKSREESEALMKSFVEERVKPLEDTLSTILDLVNKIADQPVSPRGATGRTVPLMKSGTEYGGESLSKSEVASKLFELKKSGTKVDSLDITRAEMGHDLSKIIEKYNIS
jgi:hypothetical protein